MPFGIVRVPGDGYFVGCMSVLNAYTDNTHHDVSIRQQDA